MRKSGTILIIDDEVNLRSSLSYILQRVGYQVKTASGAQEALHHLVSQQFDLVFLDLQMPGMDGMQLLPEIQLINPHLPVIILTANANLETAIQTMRRGARGYLMKPFDPEQILARADEVLREEQQSKLIFHARAQDLSSKMNGLD